LDTVTKGFVAIEFKRAQDVRSNCAERAIRLPRFAEGSPSGRSSQRVDGAANSACGGICGSIHIRCFIFYLQFHIDTIFTVCVCLLLQDLVQSCVRGEGGDIGEHVLQEMTRQGLCGLVCPSRTSEREYFLCSNVKVARGSGGPAQHVGYA
jgi:hypothetical protein